MTTIICPNCAKEKFHGYSDCEGCGMPYIHCDLYISVNIDQISFDDYLKKLMDAHLSYINVEESCQRLHNLSDHDFAQLAYDEYRNFSTETEDVREYGILGKFKSNALVKMLDMLMEKYLDGKSPEYCDLWYAFHITEQREHKNFSDLMQATSHMNILIMPLYMQKKLRGCQ